MVTRPWTDGRGRHVRPGRRRVPPLLRGRAVARAALREDALRQRAAGAAPTSTSGWSPARLRYRRVAEETLDYLLREMRAPRAGSPRRRTRTRDGVEGQPTRGPRSRSPRRSASRIPSGSCPSRTTAPSSEAKSPRTPVAGLSRVVAAAAALPRRQSDHGLERHGAGRLCGGRAPARAAGLSGSRARSRALPRRDDGGRRRRPPPHLPRRRRQDRRVPGGLRARRQRLRRASLGHGRPPLAGGGVPARAGTGTGLCRPRARRVVRRRPRPRRASQGVATTRRRPGTR